MAGRVVQEPAVHEPVEAVTLKAPTARDADVLLQLMAMLHREPLSSQFARIQRDCGTLEEMLPIIHFFEEVGALVLHRLLSQELLFDAFAIDVYWEHLRHLVRQMRRETGNAKFGENFELLAELAADYRRRRPPKVERQPAAAS
jgi:hypothetical protein